MGCLTLKANPHTPQEVIHLYTTHLDALSNKMLIQGEGRKEERNYPPLPASWLGQREDVICKRTNFKLITAVRAASATTKWKRAWCITPQQNPLGKSRPHQKLCKSSLTRQQEICRQGQNSWKS